MFYKTSFPPVKKYALSRVTHSDWIPVSCHTSPYMLRAAYKTAA